MRGNIGATLRLRTNFVHRCCEVRRSIFVCKVCGRIVHRTCRAREEARVACGAACDREAKGVSDLRWAAFLNANIGDLKTLGPLTIQIVSDL